MDIDLGKLEKEFVSLTYGSRKIILAQQAYPTSRLLNEYPDSLQFQGNGDTYMEEWQADAYDQDARPLIVRWHFEVAREGIENPNAYPFGTLAEDYDWKRAHDILERWE